MADLPRNIDVRFEGASEKIDVQLQDGARGWTEGSARPSTLFTTGGGQRTGDFDPNFSHLEQRTFHSGRGVDNYADDNTGYFDGQNLWSCTPGHLFPAPLWKFARGIKTTDEDLGVDRTWKKLIDETQYISVAIGAITDADYANLWIRRRGSPGTLTLELRANDSGDPTGTKHQTVTKTISDVTDTISVFEEFDWTSTQTLSAGDHIKIFGPDGDTADNCWEVAVDTSGSGSLISADASTWAEPSPDFTMLHRLSVADTSRTWMPFVLEGALYIVSKNDAAANSVCFINGGRGLASSGSATTLVDSGIGWTADRFIGAYVKIIAGTGKGQTRAITDNTTDTLTVATWDINPDATSRYVIYGTPWWAAVTVTGIGKVLDVAVMNNIVYFAQGSGDNILRWKCDGDGTYSFADDGTNKADILWTFYDAADGAQMWRAENDTVDVSRATKAAWNTDLVFGTEIEVGSADYDITNIRDHDGVLYVWKEDSLWRIVNDRAIRLPIGLDGLPGTATGRSVASHNLFLWFSWWKSSERLYGNTLDDEGVWKRGEGLPTGRLGETSGYVPLMPWMIKGIDAGSGTSSVYNYVNGSYHEMFRGFKAGHRVRNVFAQTNEGTNPWVWIDYNGELIYQEYSLNPLTESGFEVQHEAVMVSATYDMAHAETYKFFESLSARVKNLSTDGIEIGVDYQWGEDVGTSTWTSSDTLLFSPVSRSYFNLGETTQLRYRLRIITDDADVIPDILSTVIKGYEVLPTKRLWSMRIKASSLRSSGTDPNELYDWLHKASQEARSIKMYTVFPGIDDVRVKLEPPTTLWKFINKASRWTGVFTLTVREM